MYRNLGPVLKRLLDRIDHKVVVSKDALATVQGYLGGEYEVLFNGVATTEIRATQPHLHDRPAIFFVGRPSRTAQGPGRAVGGAAPDRSRRQLLDRR